MKKYYAKSLKEYDAPIDIDEKKILKSVSGIRKSSKLPTSVALEVSTIRGLKQLAEKKGVPYQVLMRMFIVEGLGKATKSKG